jgi:hypothetical protein
MVALADQLIVSDELFAGHDDMGRYLGASEANLTIETSAPVHPGRFAFNEGDLKI